MEITLISVSGRLACDGSRLISSLLKRAGHKVTNVYLARREPEYELTELESLNEIFRNTGLVMIAVYSNYFGRAVRITDLIHQTFPGLKVVWGGPHCIATPELSLKYADAVCFSEGDEAAIQLVNRLDAGTDYLDIPNMAFNVNGSYVINEALPPFADLDSLPYYDYGLDNQFLLDGELLPLTMDMDQSGHRTVSLLCANHVLSHLQRLSTRMLLLQQLQVCINVWKKHNAVL